MRILLVGLGLGLLFAAMDVAINANPLARRLYSVYAPVAKTTVNALAGILIDLAWGLVVALTFIQLSPALPGDTGLVKGLALGGGIWVFRVAMGVATTWMTHRVPPALLGYQLATGLGEMLVLGAVAGVLLTPV